MWVPHCMGRMHRMPCRRPPRLMAAGPHGACGAGSTAHRMPRELPIQSQYWNFSRMSIHCPYFDMLAFAYLRSVGWRG